MLRRNINVNALKKKKKAQSTVEYILLVAAVLGALIIFLKPNGVFQTAYNNALTTGSKGMTAMASRLVNSHNITP